MGKQMVEQERAKGHLRVVRVTAKVILGLFVSPSSVRLFTNPALPTIHDGQEIPAYLRPVLQAAAKHLLHHLYGCEGLRWGTCFADLEERVVQSCHSLGREMLKQALQQQADQAVPEPLRSCPSRGGPTKPRSQ